MKIKRDSRFYCDDCGQPIVRELAMKTVEKYGKRLCTVCALLVKPLEKANKEDLSGLTPDEMELLAVIEERLNGAAYRAERDTIVTDASGLDKTAQDNLEKAYRLKRAFAKLKTRLGSA